jgi:flagellar biosynthesis/type III secretory pathway protein FliH
MDDTFIINLDKPIRSAQILNDYKDARCQILDTRQASRIENRESRIEAEFAQSLQTLNSLINKLNQFYDELLARHREEIAKLSVEIANKVLMQKLQKGDYKIESIINEALKNAPARQDMVVHLNPDDIAQLQKLRQHDPTNTLANIKFVADPAIGRAECLLETPKGIIKSFIKEHIERISDALAKVG